MSCQFSSTILSTSIYFHVHSTVTIFFFCRRAEIFYSLVTIRDLVVDANERIPELLTKARRNLGLFQHHDGITGTAKELVVKDYAKRQECFYFLFSKLYVMPCVASYLLYKSIE